MNRQKWTILLIAFALIGGTAGGLAHLRTHQRLGPPGIIATPIPDSKRWDIYLPPKVLDYNSEIRPTDTNVLEGLPHDTSFATRLYHAPDGQQFLCNVVLMGTDRTSIHKPQFCLTGAGWTIKDANPPSDAIRIERPYPYDLPVKKLVTDPRELVENGKTVTASGIYVYWFVAENELTDSHWDRMWRISTHLLGTGELQRWAYVSCFTICVPGDEARTYNRMKQFIAASVPEFQKATGTRVASASSPQAALR